MEGRLKYISPSTLGERTALRERVRAVVSSLDTCPPLSLGELERIALEIVKERNLDPALLGWLMVEANNAVWRSTVASIPRERRLLMLPKCLRNSSSCCAEIDSLGLLCHGCGNCGIASLLDLADSFGTNSIVAEGFTSAVSLIKSGVVDGVIGVGCLDSLEKAFPLLIDNAVPGMAVALNFDGCKDTEVDLPYVMDMIRMEEGPRSVPINYSSLSDKVKDFFHPDTLASLFSPVEDPTEKAALSWLCSNGKRFRPSLLCAVYEALSGSDEIPDFVQSAALAVECFHKASLVHDDIQDGDLERYGRPSVHASLGVPMAINVGDLLLGKGYSLLAGCHIPELMEPISQAHIELCKGQGLELDWSRKPSPFTVEFALDIASRKTVPAFGMSLVLGMLCAGRKEYRGVLDSYALALGTAYQILDDVSDFDNDTPLRPRPSFVLALLGKDAASSLFEGLSPEDDIKAAIQGKGLGEELLLAKEQARCLAQAYADKAAQELSPLRNIELKRLLFRVRGKILDKNNK